MRRSIRFSIYDMALWLNLILLHFGFVVLAMPQTAGLRGPICGISIIFSMYLCFTSVNRPETRNLSIWVLICTFFAMVLGFYHGANLTGIVLDTTVSLSVFCAIELCYATDEKIDKYLQFVAISAIISFAFLYIRNPISMSQVLARGAIWTGTYYCTSMFWAAPFMLVRSYLKKKQMFLPMLYFIVAGIINILYLKRQFIVEAIALIVILALYSMIKSKSIGKTIKILIITVAILGIGYFVLEYVLHLGVNEIIERILLRFDQTEETGFIRFTETSNYFSNADIIDVILGRGFGVSHYGLGKENTALHIGASNLIFKYGIMLIPVVLHYMFRVIKCVFSRENGDSIVSATIIISLINIPEFFLLSNFWLTTPCYLWFWFCLLACTYRDEEELIYTEGVL